MRALPPFLALVLPLCLADTVPAREVVIAAHRGSSAAAPENTLAAFALGFSVGADAIECDLRTSFDGEIVMMHDGDLARTTDGAGPVGDFTLAELKLLDAGSWHSAAFAGERIPTLAETLASAVGNGKVLLDIKVASPTDVAAAVAAGSLPESDVLVLTWSTSQEGQFATALPNATVLRTPWNQPSSWTDAYILNDASLGGDGYAFWYSTITEAFVADAHRLGMLVFAFTVNSSADAQRLVDLGVDGLISDVPATIRAGVDFDPTLRVRQFALGETGNPTLTWRSIVGRSYRVESCADLSSDWIPFDGGETIATSILSSFEAEAPADPQRFYRVVEME